MKRDYSSGVNDTVMFFEGVEIEKTPAHGMHTLFVVGLHTVETILEQLNGHQHIYLGANKSYAGSAAHWMELVHKLADTTDCWITLDFPIDEYRNVIMHLKGTMKKFIPMISIEMPWIESTGYNTCIKIDDEGIDFSNPGVWVHRLNTLLTDQTLTRWDDYSKDTPLEK